MSAGEVKRKSVWPVIFLRVSLIRLCGGGCDGRRFVSVICEAGVAKSLCVPPLLRHCRFTLPLSTNKETVLSHRPSWRLDSTGVLRELATREAVQPFLFSLSPEQRRCVGHLINSDSSLRGRFRTNPRSLCDRFLLAAGSQRT